MMIEELKLPANAEKTQLDLRHRIPWDYVRCRIDFGLHTTIKTNT
jgi:hypothetical protein